MLWWAIACQQPPVAPQQPPIAEIVVEPADLVVHTGPDGADPVEFTAMATYRDGSTAALPLVEWSLSNRSVGEIDAEGTFTPSDLNGGITWVKAELDGAEGFATVTVIYEREIVDTDVDPSVFDGLPEVEVDGVWRYPSDGVNMPRNTPSLAFQWNDVPNALAYRLRFRSEVTDLTVYTRQPTWVADGATWAGIASTNAGGEVTVELAAAADGQAQAEAPIAIQVNRLDATGSIYYWSTSAAGIREIPYGGEGVDFLTPTQTGRCVACHAIGPGGLIAVTYDGGNGRLGVKRMGDLSDVVSYDSSQYANFKTFSPDGRYLLGTFEGALMLWDAQTGAFLHEVPVNGYATHVDWAPDDTRVAITLVDDAPWDDWTFAGNGRIAVLDHLGDGQFGGPQVIYDPPDAGLQAYYPAWSPDSEWIAFNVSAGDSYDDPDAEVWVADGTGTVVVPLLAANGAGDLTNSWPRWAPLPDDDVLWLAFASRRVYGRDRNYAQDVNGNWYLTPQIWVAAFDPAKALDGEDPSWPAFWLPGQDVVQGNHIPVWAE